MPVNGPTGPKPPPKTSTATTQSQTVPPPTASRPEEPDDPTLEQPVKSLINTQDTSSLPGWMPGRTHGRSLPEEIDGPLTSDAVMQAALDRFTMRFDNILGQDPISLARGGHLWREGDTLSDQQQKDLMRATEDLLKDTPINKLSPKLQQSVEEAMQRHGMHRDLSSTRLGDLGGVGGELARAYVNKLRQETPTAFYAVGATAAAALGYVAWTQGSEGLRHMGVRPEADVDLNDHVNIGGGVEFDQHFSNLSGYMSADVGFGGNGKPDFRLGGEVGINHQGKIDSFTGTASMTTGNFAAAGMVTMTDKKFESAAASFVYTPSSNFSLSGGAMWYQPDRRLTVGAEAAWRLSKNAEFAASASHDSMGGNRIGVGARIRF